MFMVGDNVDTSNPPSKKAAYVLAEHMAFACHRQRELGLPGRCGSWSAASRGDAIERAGLYGKLSQLNPVGQAAPKPADFLGFVPSQTLYPPIGTTPILPLNVAILAPDTAFPSFRNRYPANVPTLSAYRIILPVL